ncbi:hypothetical protein [Mariniblastus fucicola]|uniref:Polyketide synthase n=1 Tax=Mariniblastus fucicola TaxID=980251 RepID=A0A5B9PI85_9BACT|nr:hypothetical protein [Mariniblastus fucicola]QEG22531.1 hypothetical protein MFFC18_24120 [Mariniblastus fucicola]
MLGKLRRRIRLIVLVEGILAIIVVILICFWLTFAMDYVPVKFGFPELSSLARASLLAIVITLAVVQLYRYIGRRFFVSMKNHSLALLIEKKHPQFEESLVTTVNHHEAANRADVPIDATMLEMTQAKAESLVEQVDPGEIVGFRFLRTTAILAGLLVASVIGLGVLNFDNLRLAVQRIYMLEDQPWPRRVYLELSGLKIKTENPVPGIDELGQTLSPVNRSFRIPRGSSLMLTVRAEDSNSLIPWRRLPSSCLMYFRTADGESGTQALNRIGNPRDGWQTWSLNGSPLESVLSDIEFTIRGDDFRDGPYRIEIVDQAIVTETSLDCVYPEYLSSNDSLSWTPRTVRWTGRASLPVGTSFSVNGVATKPLKKVYVWNATTSTMQQGDVDGTDFRFNVPPIGEPVNLQFYFVDSDNLVSDSPHSVSVEPISDEAPDVVARLVGIGTAITPDAMLSFEGQIVDDYRVQETWVELATAERKLPPAVMPTGEGGKLESSIDMAELVRAGLSLTVDDGSELDIIIKAKDFYSLNGQSPNVGVGDRYSLEIVSANHLLRMLERIEVSQRRRLEQVFEEVTDIRGYLSRTRKQADFEDPDDSEPGDREPGDGNVASRKQAMRIVFSQRSKLQSIKSAQEIRGIAEAFDNLRLQLINNRVDAEDRKERLAGKIIAPLRAIPTGALSVLSDTIDELETVLKQIDQGISDEQSESDASDLVDRGLLETDAVLKEIDAVLAELVKYESQNELLEIVRRMITEQEALMKRTREKRQKDAFEGLLD